MKTRNFVSKNRQNQIRSQIQTIFKLISNQNNKYPQKNDKYKFMTPKNQSLAQSNLIEDKIQQPNLILTEQGTQKNLKQLKYNQLIYALVYKKMSILIITNYVKRNIQNYNQVNQQWFQLRSKQEIFNDVIQILNKHISQQWKQESFLKKQLKIKEKQQQAEHKKEEENNGQINQKNKQYKKISEVDFSRRQILKKIKTFKSQMSECQAQMNMATSKKNQQQASLFSKKYISLSKKYNFWKQKYRLQKQERLQNQQQQTNQIQQSKQIKINDSQIMSKIGLQNRNKNIQNKINQLMETINQITLQQKRIDRLKSLQNNDQTIIKVNKNQGQSYARYNNNLESPHLKSKQSLKSFQSSKQKQLSYIKKVFKHYVLAQTKLKVLDQSYKNSIDSKFSQNDIKQKIKYQMSRVIDNNHFRHHNNGINQVQDEHMTLQSFTKFIKDFELSAPTKSPLNCFSQTGQVLTATQLVKLFKLKSSNKRTLKYSQFVELFQLIYEKQCQKLGIQFQPKLFDCFLQKEIFSFEKINKVLRLNITRLNEQQRLKQQMKGDEFQNKKSNQVKRSNTYQQLQSNTSPMKTMQNKSSIYSSDKQPQSTKNGFYKNSHNISSNKQIAPSFIQYRFLPASHTGKFPQQIAQKLNANKKTFNQVPCMNPQFRKPLTKPRRGIFLKYSQSFLQPQNKNNQLINEEAIILRQKAKHNKKNKSFDSLPIDQSQNQPKKSKAYISLIPTTRQNNINTTDSVYKNSLSSYTKRFKFKKLSKRVYTLDNHHQNQQQNEQDKPNSTNQANGSKINLNRKTEEQIQLQKIIGIQEQSQDQYGQQSYMNQDFQNSHYMSEDQQRRSENTSSNYVKEYQKRQSQQDDAYMKNINPKQLNKWLLHF